MIYKKDPKVKYTDMCIYIDKHIYSGDFDEEKVFEYLYHISNMLSHKGKYFYRAEDYENFSLYMATNVYIRLTNKKQFEYHEDGTPKMKKIKSVLNYMKKIIDHRRIDYQQQFFDQSISVESDTSLFDDDYSLCQKLSAHASEAAVNEFIDCLSNDIVYTTRKFLSKNVYYGNKMEWNNIYLSCLLTLLNSMTINKKERTRISLLKNQLRQPEVVERLYEQQGKSIESVVLYHLPEYMRDYILVLTRRLKSVIGKDLSVTLHKNITTEDTFKSLMFSELNSTKINKEETNDYWE